MIAEFRAHLVHPQHDAKKTAIIEAIRAAENEVLERAAEIALAIDSNRGNEKEIANAIRRLKTPATTPEAAE